MNRSRSFLAAGTLLAALLPLAAVSAGAEPVKVPDLSQKATLSQTLGMTEVAIVYHRPLVRGRVIWGGLVPYDQVWRAGANENTTFAVSDDVTIDGQPLPAGTYGLHTIPGKDEWTVIFSKNSTSWGSFFYDSKEDALRVKVKPVAADFHEALTYDFDDPQPGSAVATLRWEKLAVPFKVAVDVDAVTVASLRRQLRSLPGFTWDGFNSAAAWCVQAGVDLDEALGWADQSIQIEEHFENLETRSLILAKQGKAEEAAAAMARALELAGVGQLHNYGRQLIAQGKKQEAMKVFETNASRHPESWIPPVGLARGYSALGDFPAAVKSLREAIAKAPEGQKAALQGLLARLEKNQDIN